MTSDRANAVLKVFAAIFRDVAQVFFASLVIPVLLDAVSPTQAIWGTTGAIVFWLLSIVTIRHSV